MMKTLLPSALALGALATTALAEPVIPTGAAAAEPAAPEEARAGGGMVAAERTGRIELGTMQMDEITAGVVWEISPGVGGPGFDLPPVYVPHPCPPGQFCIQ